MKNVIKMNSFTEKIMNYVSINVCPLSLTNVNEIVILLGFDESFKTYVVSVLNVSNFQVEHLFYNGLYHAREAYSDFVRAFRVLKH